MAQKAPQEKLILGSRIEDWVIGALIIFFFVTYYIPRFVDEGPPTHATELAKE